MALLRFNRAAARKVVDDLGIPIVKSDAHGITIQREVVEIATLPGGNGQGLDLITIKQSWRLYTGGGIAGNSDKIWLRPIFTLSGLTARGPFSTRRDLTKALRAWRRGK